MKVPTEQLRGNIDDFDFYDNMEEIRQVPGYTERIDPEVDEFSSISGHYRLKDKEKTPCQKLGCRQPHGKGYLIRLKSGKVSNIGNVCGRKFDPDNFVIHARMAENKIRHLGALRFAQKLQDDFEYYYDLVERIKSESKAFLISRADFKKSIERGEDVVEKLKEIANRADYSVYRTRRLSDEEFKEAKKVREYPSREVNEHMGDLVNVKCFSLNETDIFLKAQKALKALQDLDPLASSTSELNKVSTSVMEIQKGIDKIKDAQSELEKFRANVNNINLLPYIF
ncbi:hypothetical protein [Chromobacterium haemolyticum]|uniref:hypothetical protein n=1 Tax=Chromobacterium TaxID=535 RepID=UPI0040575027